MSKLTHDVILKLFSTFDTLCNEKLNIQKLQSNIYVVSQVLAESNLPDDAQQLLIEYTCLPILQLDEDARPSSNFTIEVLRIIQKYYIDLYEIKDLITKFVLPVISYSSPMGKGEEYESKKLKKLKLCVNCYFVYLVGNLQHKILSQLSEMLDIFSNKVRKWALRALFFPACKSKHVGKREVALKTMENYRDELDPFFYLEKVEFLSHKLQKRSITGYAIPNANVLVRDFIESVSLWLVQLAEDVWKQMHDVKKTTRILRICSNVVKGDLKKFLSVVMKKNNEFDPKQIIALQKIVNGNEFQLHLKTQVAEKISEILQGFILTYIQLR